VQIINVQMPLSFESPVEKRGFFVCQTKRVIARYDSEALVRHEFSVIKFALGIAAGTGPWLMPVRV
jgi:hypothetical protein